MFVAFGANPSLHNHSNTLSHVNATRIIVKRAIGVAGCRNGAPVSKTPTKAPNKQRIGY